MIRSVLQKAISCFATTRISALVARQYLLQHPSTAIEILQICNKKRLESAITPQKETLNSFEDLAWLFSTNKSNRGVLRLDFDEAAYLFSLVKSLGDLSLVEIGRFDGGSTILFSAATSPRSRINSIDIMPQDDTALNTILKKYGWDQKVRLIVADANTVPAPEASYDVVFIDGDHSYEAAKKDYEHWKYAVKAGGHLLFHDCDESGPEVVRVCNEVEPTLYKKVAQVNSIAHFVRK